MRLRLPLLLAALCALLPGCYSYSSLPVLPINATAVQCAVAVQQAADSSSNTTAASLLHSLATAALASPLYTITATNTTTGNTTAAALPPNDDPHYYYSLDPYWWPSPACDRARYPYPAYLTQCEYATVDGAVNPDTQRAVSQPQLAALVHDATVLALAAIALDPSSFDGGSVADKAAAQLTSFFLAADTLMEPNLIYAQTRWGNNTAEHGGRPEALIDMRALPLLLQAEQMLYASNASAHWAAEQHGQWQAWVAAYEQWAATSAQGQQAAALPNRHSTWYACQLLALAHHDARNATAANSTLHAYLAAQYDAQFNASGQQPLEQDGSAEWYDRAVSNAEALDCIASYAALLDLTPAPLHRTPNAHGVTLYNVTLALLAAAGTGAAAQPARQQRLLPLAYHVLTVYGDSSDGRLSGFVSSAGQAAGVQVYGLWLDGASGGCVMPAAGDGSWAFYVQVLIVVALTAVSLAAIAICVWRTRDSDVAADDDDKPDGDEADEEEDEGEESGEEEEEEDNHVRLTHSRDSSLVSVTSDLGAALLADTSSPRYDDTLVVPSGRARHADGRRKTRVSTGMQQAPRF